MKKLIIGMAVIGSLSSCEKYDDYNPSSSLQAHAVEPIRPSRHLTLQMLDVNLYKMQSTKTYLFQEGGYRYEWNVANEQYTLLFQVDVDSTDAVKNITGRYNGTPFIMWNGALNFCNGAQGVGFNFTIYK